MLVAEIKTVSTAALSKISVREGRRNVAKEATENSLRMASFNTKSDGRKMKFHKMGLKKYKISCTTITAMMLDHKSGTQLEMSDEMNKNFFF
jgi:hypothetical protein